MEQLDPARSIYYRHFDLPARFPVVGLLGDLWRISDAPVTRMHFHNCMEIGLILDGSGEFFAGGDVLRFHAPCLLIAPPNVPHAHRAASGTSCRCNWLYVDPQALLPGLNPRLAGMLGEYQRSLSGEDCVIPADAQPDAFALVRMIAGEMERAQMHHQHVVRELFSAAFLMLLRGYRGSDARSRYAGTQLGSISPAITYIAAHYMEDISIEHLGRLCHVSASHFRRLFKQMLGWTPLDYVQMVRIDRACTLLYNCEYSVTEIGLQVGYPTPSSFNRQFRRIYGISPGQWRQKMRSEENPVVTAYFHSLPPSTTQFFPSEYPTL